MGQKLGVLIAPTPEISLYAYYCPACGEIHEFSIRKAVEQFMWNQNLEKPYVNYSLCNRTIRKNLVIPCHLSIIEGNLVYFMDSGHHLAGTIEPMRDWTEH